MTVSRNVSILFCLLLHPVLTVGCAISDPLTAVPTDGAHKLNAYQLITGDDLDEEREGWNRAYKNRGTLFGEKPMPFVVQSVPLVRKGRALVLAMEEGSNAIYLAKQGFQVTGVDFSDEAIRRAKRFAKKSGVKLDAVNADLNNYNIEPEAYDLIVAVDFYRSRLVGEIRKGLKHGGTALWVSHTLDSRPPTFVENSVQLDQMPRPGALHQAFADYKLIISNETPDGDKMLAQVLARKP
jgi:tellurite methyltransferase